MLEGVGAGILVAIIAGNTTGMLALGVQTYRMMQSHDRALYGDEQNARDGLVSTVSYHEEKIDEHDDALDEHDRRIERNASRPQPRRSE